ncbi:MAG: deoxyhypusine synthase family protein [Bacteroidales bacterium]|nr:deoxyhypusine synthase family protein [Bacteroidales bacterium]
MDKGQISAFMEEHFRHFNAASLLDASRAYREQLDAGAKMMITLAGAMSTAELGRSLAEMIRNDKVHIITCTGANLEEDVFNLVAHNHYKRIPDYRSLGPEQETELLKTHYNRVTDTCIPEEEAMRRIERHLIGEWKEAGQKGERYFPHEYFYNILKSGKLENDYEIDPSDSWLLAAAEKNIPVIVPGWEDSTCGNFFASHCIRGLFEPSIVRSGIEYMIFLAEWYRDKSSDGVGFFQIGGGIAGDFPICVVPMLHQDLQLIDIPVWSYFCQISDSTTSYGSYSGAVPNEKITWGKLSSGTPKFIIESDATIVAPLMFAYILGW